jgi:hypothetical protein
MDLRLSDLTTSMDAANRRTAALVAAMAKYHKACYDRETLDMYLCDLPHAVVTHVKAAVSPLDAATSGLAPTRPLVQAVLAAVDRISVLGQLGAIKVPVTNVGGAAQTVSASAYWVGEAVAKPVSALGFAALGLTPRKVVSQVVATDELLRRGLDAVNLLERATVSPSAGALDVALLDPANAGIADVKPASLTNGLTGITPAGDFANNVGQVLNAISGGAPTRPVLVASLQSALRLAAIPNIADYVKVLVSPAASNNLIAIDADGIAYVDNGGDLQIGRPDIQMNDAPDSPSTAATVMVSAWQRNLTVVKLERFVNWAKRSDAVAYRRWRDHGDTTTTADDRPCVAGDRRSRTPHRPRVR